jgi:hypothetical protein
VKILIFLGINHRLDFSVIIVVASLWVKAYDTTFIFIFFSKK